MAREHMPSWERLWDDFVQEELRVGSRSSSQQQGGDGDEGDLALLEKGKKKTKQGPKGGAKQPQRGGEQWKDMSKVKCFACNQLGHYVDSVPTGRRRSRVVLQRTIEEDEFASQFERECSLIVCCSTIESPSSVWYIDSGASSHMSGVRENFTDLRDT
jgi:hypothetical protein